MGKTNKEKIDDFIASTVESVLALLTLVIDALYWLGWGYITSWTGVQIEALKVPGAEAWPYKIGQIAGCGVLAWLVFLKTAKDAISAWDNFQEFLSDRNNNAEEG